MAREKTPDAQVAADFFISFLNYYMDRIAEKNQGRKKHEKHCFHARAIRGI